MHPSTGTLPGKSLKNQAYTPGTEGGSEGVDRTARRECRAEGAMIGCRWQDVRLITIAGSVPVLSCRTGFLESLKN